MTDAPMLDRPDRSVERDALDILPTLFGYRVRRLHTTIVAGWLSYFEELGIAVTPVQAGMLMLIDRHPGITQIALARMLSVEAPTLHQSLRRLVETDLVVRRPAENDRRAQALTLTPHGTATLATIRERVAAQEAEIFQVLSAEEQAQFGRMLDRLIGI